VTQKRNGSYELEMEYPVQGIHYSDITLQRIILAKPDELSRNQPFRIYDISKPMSGAVTVYARHIAYGLMGIPVKPFTSASASEAMQGLITNAAVDCPYTFSTDKETTATMTVDVPTAIWSLLGGSEGGILDVYGGEYEFDKYAVTLHKERGENRGVVIRYGKNLTDLKQEQSCANVYTGVYPYWKSTDGKLVQLAEKVLNAEGTYPVTRILPLDLSSEWENAPTEDQLRTRAQTYMASNQIGVPTVSLTVEFVQIGQIEQIAICDTVTVYFEQIGVSATAKVTKTVYDVLQEQYDSIDIGYARQTYNQMIASYNRRVDRTASKRDIQRASASISASTKTELSGYATQAYVTQQIQAAVVSTWEASY
jgi:phage minor structural protein